MNRTVAVKSRAAAIAAGGLVFFGIFFALAGPSWELALYRIMQDGGCAILWLLSAGGFGWIAWKAFGLGGKNSLMAVTSVALGLGIMSLGILGLGLGGMDESGMGGWNCGGGGFDRDIGRLCSREELECRRLVRGASKLGLVRGSRRRPSRGLCCSAPVSRRGFCGAMSRTATTLSSITFRCRENGMKRGESSALHHNVFSYFPFNVEMHYLLAMFLHGGVSGPWAGMYLAQMMHVGFCAAVVWAVYALAGGGRKGIVAGRWWRPCRGRDCSEPSRTTRAERSSSACWRSAGRFAQLPGAEFALAGLFAGFAAGTKLSVAPLILAAVPIVVFVTRPRCWAGCFAYLLAAILVLSPWLIRNWKWSGNPVFPEAMSVLGQNHFSGVQVERWREAYWPDPKYRSAIGHVRGLWTEVLADSRFGWVLFPLGIAAAVMGFRNRAMICLAMLLIFQIMFWITFTHLQSRFMVIAIPMIALMVAQMEFRGWTHLTAAAVVAMAGLSMGVLIAENVAISRDGPFGGCHHRPRKPRRVSIVRHPAIESRPIPRPRRRRRRILVSDSNDSAALQDRVRRRHERSRAIHRPGMAGRECRKTRSFGRTRRR